MVTATWPCASARAPGCLPGSAQVAAVGQAWRPFRSTALMHLWAEYLQL